MYQIMIEIWALYFESSCHTLDLLCSLYDALVPEKTRDAYGAATWKPGLFRLPIYEQIIYSSWCFLLFSAQAIRLKWILLTVTQYGRTYIFHCVCVTHFQNRIYSIDMNILSISNESMQQYIMLTVVRNRTKNVFRINLKLCYRGYRVLRKLSDEIVTILECIPTD